jgi:hypothetical protein
MPTTISSMPTTISAIRTDSLDEGTLCAMEGWKLSLRNWDSYKIFFFTRMVFSRKCSTFCKTSFKTCIEFCEVDETENLHTTFTRCVIHENMERIRDKEMCCWRSNGRHNKDSNVVPKRLSVRYHRMNSKIKTITLPEASPRAKSIT